MSTPFADGKGPRPDSTAEWLFLLFVATVVMAVAAVATLQYVQANPGAPWQLEAAASSALSFTGETVISSNTTLELSVEDAQYMNRIYRELDGYTETGYCVVLLGSEIRVSKAATLEATAETLKFTTSNCQERVDGTIHTHLPDSEPVLSGSGTAAREDYNDKKSLLVAGYEISCVQAGLVTTTAGQRTAALRCYTKPASGDIADEFPELPVVVMD